MPEHEKWAINPQQVPVKQHCKPSMGSCCRQTSTSIKPISSSGLAIKVSSAVCMSPAQADILRHGSRAEAEMVVREASRAWRTEMAFSMW